MAKTGRRATGDDRELKSARIHVAITDSQFENLAWLRLRLKLSNAELIGQWIDEAFKMQGGVLAEPVDLPEDFTLLIGFLNCLLDTYDHDGYSLAEIGAILGRKTGDRDLIELIDKLQSSIKPEGVEHGE